MSIVDEMKLRRLILKVLGSSAVMAPFLSISACSGEKSAPPDSAPGNLTPADRGETSVPPQPEAPVEGTTADSALPQLTEDDPQAIALSYVADATRVDSAKFPRYETGQTCANCALFLDEEGSQFAPCSIFAGKLVNAAGWCSVYAPKV